MNGGRDWSHVAEHLIGVIDLQDGVAVHGVAGNRQQYAAVHPLWRSGQVADGDPLALADWYREQFQLRQFYIADLEALQNRAPQRAMVESLIAHGDTADRWLIDVGICLREASSQTEWMREIDALRRNVQWIIASESATSTTLISQVCESIPPDALVLGLDFREGQFVGPAAGMEDWISAAAQAGMRCGLVLDVATVGTRVGPQTASLCRSLNQQLPDWRWISGGGIRHADDARVFLDAGCTDCLVASALLPVPHTP